MPISNQSFIYSGSKESEVTVAQAECPDTTTKSQNAATETIVDETTVVRTTTLDHTTSTSSTSVTSTTFIDVANDLCESKDGESVQENGK